MAFQVLLYPVKAVSVHFFSIKQASVLRVRNRLKAYADGHTNELKTGEK